MPERCVDLSVTVDDRTMSQPATDLRLAMTPHRRLLHAVAVPDIVPPTPPRLGTPLRSRGAPRSPAARGPAVAPPRL